MGHIAAVEPDTAEPAQAAVPYPPSLVDRFTDWVDRLAGPSWLFYAGLWLVLYLIEVATQWTGSAAPTLQPFHVVFVGTIPLSLALIHYLDKTAASALSKFRPALTGSSAEYAELLYRLTTLPARPVVITALLSVVLDLFFPSSDTLLERLFIESEVSLNYNFAVSVTVGACIGVLFYHTLHQLIVVSQIYRRARVNLFQLEPLYTFANLSARTAIGVLAITYSWYLTVPEFSSELASFVWELFFLAAAIITFLWPLLGVHNLLVAEKQWLLVECGRWQEAAITKLHHMIETDKLEAIDAQNKVLASLELEHTLLRRISTWPWQPETVRWFVAALLFPVVVWLIQWVLQRVLSP